ncbi:U3 small nucleolar RNA-associated protein 14 homolog A-like [Scylla paramamosain]|uniref:U3 small nucleolar RNA-associated protein 14 homolog A-like n=1 Tax=Scylla paramamosain TaxID=85552 RepID=UPI003083846C
MVKIKTTSVREKEQEDEELFMVSGLDNIDGGEDDNNEEEEGDDQQEASHAQLLSNMMKITKKERMQQDVRTSMGTSTMDTSHLLTRLLPSTSLLKAKSSHTLSLPLEKSVAKRIKRAAGYENVAMEVNKWAKVVKAQRETEQLRFPLKQSGVSLKTVEKTNLVQMRTPLENEVYSLLQGAKLVENKKESEEEMIARKALSLEEIREQNRELWRQKELKRRYEQKARLMNKSKSRKHHRLLRREKLRKQKTKLEELQKTDPEAALECLQELELARIQERMSLRHKTSKWAHLQGFRANRDKTVMAALKENQRLHQELTTKSAKAKESVEDDLSDEADLAKGEGGSAVQGTDESLNPWIKQRGSVVSKSSPEDESFTKFKKFWEEVNKRKQADQEIHEQLEKEREEKNIEDEKIEDQEQEEEKKTEKEGVEEEEENSGMKEEGEQTEKEKEVNKKYLQKLQKPKDKIQKLKRKKAESEDSGEPKGKIQKLKRKKAESEDSGEPKGKIQKLKCKKAEAEDSGEQPAKKIPGKKGNKKCKKIIKTKDQEAVNIDDLFDEVEIGIKNKVQRKLKKLGVKSKEPWTKVKTKKKNKKVPKAVAPSEIEEFDFTGTRNQENIDETTERAKTLQDLESLEGESVNKLQEAVKILKDSQAPDTSVPHNHKLQVDPNKFLQVESKRLVTAMPDNVGEAGEALDDEEQESAENIIREAFADDYLMEEFSSEKAEAIKKDQPSSMSLALPGWGDWTGPNMKMSSKKIKKFRLRVAHAPRKDSRIGHVLYNEKADVHTNLRKAMVSELPYPFKSVKDFEASVRAPVGRLFVPETAHKKMTAPPIVTKMGTVIQPMTEDELLRSEAPGKGLKKNRQSGPSRDRKRKAASGAHEMQNSKRKIRVKKSSR